MSIVVKPFKRHNTSLTKTKASWDRIATVFKEKCTGLIETATPVVVS